MENNLNNTNTKETGASLVEYALLLALLTVITIAALRLLGASISGQFSALGSFVVTER